MPTGRTSLAIYDELARLHEEGGADFSKAHTFNLDEFVGIRSSHKSSYCAFMTKHLWVTKYDPTERYATGEYPNQHPGGAGGGREEGGQHQHRRRLAGAVRAEEAEDLAARNDQIESGHRDFVPVGSRDGFKLDHGRASTV